MNATATPPRWAEALLRAFLRPGEFESVSGDLLEQYRDSIHPSRGQRGANVWYVVRVFGFVAPGALLFAALFGAEFLARVGLDWFAPPADFHARASATTALAAGTLLAAGFCAAWRSGVFTAGFVAGLLTAGLASVISIVGVVALLVVWHDPQTMAAIRGSGGLEEVFTLPLLIIVPGILLGGAGGVAGAVFKRLSLT